MTDNKQAVTSRIAAETEGLARLPWAGGDDWEPLAGAALRCPELTPEDAEVFRGMFPPAPRPVQVPVMEPAA